MTNKEPKHKINLKQKIRILKNTLKPAFFKKPYMTHLWITRNCNIHCKFCYVRDYKSVDPSIKEIEKRLDKIKELGCRLTCIMGGEPTMRKDLPDIIKECEKRDILSYLVTNGTLLNKKMIDGFGKAGLDVISISFDALEFKDSLLIKYGKYECDPREKLDLLKYAQEQYDILAFVAICITSHNMDKIMPLMKVAKKYNLAISLTVMADPYIIPGHIHQNWQEEKNEVLLKKEKERKALRKLLVDLKKIKKEGARIIEPNAYFNRVINMLDGKKIKKIDCKAGLQFFDINTDGRIMLCVMADPIKLYYSELTPKNFKEKLKPFRDKQLAKCCDKCMLAPYLETSYYADHPIELTKTLMKLY